MSVVNFDIRKSLIIITTLFLLLHRNNDFSIFTLNLDYFLLWVLFILFLIWLLNLLVIIVVTFLDREFFLHLTGFLIQNSQELSKL